MTFSLSPEDHAVLRRERRANMTPEERETEDREIDEEHYQNVAAAHQQLREQATTALIAVGRAKHTIKDFSTNVAYDSEIDGPAGDDAIAWLDQARRCIQAAMDRIHAAAE